MPRRNLWSSKSAYEVAFQTRYLEVILDSLLSAPLARQPWSCHARKHLDRAREERAIQVWRGPSPGSVFLTEMGDDIRDEVIWNIAHSLGHLYGTQEFGVEAAGLLVAADDRYFVHRASAALPAPEARSNLTLKAWDRILTEFADTVYIDLLLWAVQISRPDLTLGDLITWLTEALQSTATARRTDGDEGEWSEAWKGFAERVQVAVESRRSQPLAVMTLGEASAFAGDVIREATRPYIPNHCCPN